MNDARKIYKPRPISGFPEWLPEIRRAELAWLDHIRKVFESYGYGPLETPAVEELGVITAKGGDADKEIYVIERLHKDENDKEARLALHFDQTVPMARYVAQHFSDLSFPFKRYQMQKVWRGERPQAGRFREFYQCDIDVINVDNLPLHFDAEMPAVIWEILTALPGMESEKIELRISNRKILMGLLKGLNVENIPAVMHVIDKLDKLSESKIAEMLHQDHKLDDGSISTILNLLTSSRPLLSSPRKRGSGYQTDKIPAFAGMTALNGITALNEEMQEGLEELQFVMDQLSHIKQGVVADLSIVRGLDYYTGTVYETVFVDDPHYGSICSGGRYDDLAGSYINKHLPGVGISIGFSRLFDRLRQKGALPKFGASPAHVLVMLLEEAQRPVAAAKAQELRAKGFNVEMYHAATKIGKQFQYAEKKGIPFVLTPMDDAANTWEIKNLLTRHQKNEKDGMDDLLGYVQKSK